MTGIGEISSKWRLRLVQFIIISSTLTISIELGKMFSTHFMIPELQREPFQSRPTVYSDYITALRSRADTSGFIVLALFDESFVDAAANLYEVSFRPHNIENFLFVGVGSRACPLLQAYKPLPCFMFADDKDASVTSDFGKEDFKRKMNIRTRMIIDALKADLTVLHTDTDVTFVNNPIAKLKVVLKTAHIAMMWDNINYNAGFLVVRPTWLTKLLYKKTRVIAKQTGLNDQISLNKSIRKVMKMYRKKRFRKDFRKDGIGLQQAIVPLDKRRFVCGLDYFQKSIKSRAEWNPMEVCSNSTTKNRKSPPCADVVHNNWIVGKSAKIFRFREHLMWSYDPDGNYYAGRNANYLTYQIEKQGADLNVQLSALKTALAFGYLLDRIVILRRFRCDAEAAASECPLSAVIDVNVFDGQFAGRYRESSFLVNSRVPLEVRQGLSAVQRCRRYTEDTGTNADRGDPATAASKLATESRRQTSGDIIARFGSFDDRVLVFDSFADEDCFPSFDDHSDGEAFAMKLKRGFVDVAILQP